MKQKTYLGPFPPYFFDNLPPKPGVYLMKNVKDEIIYIGKARNLKKRVRSYFNAGEKDIKTRFLVKKIADIEYIITNTEYEALLLENTLIKKWKPHYNINLKDGKTYPVIRVTAEDFPRVFRTRRIIQDGSSYYGPFPDIYSIDRYLALIDKLFPLRKCRGSLKKREHPCLYYHIGRCSAPCCGRISKEEYQERIKKVKSLLSGDITEIIRELNEKMKEASSALNFEKAAELRDTIESVKISVAEQTVEDFTLDRKDYIAALQEEIYTVFVVFQMRQGKLIGSDIFRSKSPSSEEESISEFLVSYYSTLHDPPEKVYLKKKGDYEDIENFFKKELHASVQILAPETSRDRSVISLAMDNASQELTAWRNREEKEELLKEAKKVLRLKTIPRRIEGFDIAQLSGKYPVASMVSFYNGRPDKSNYRRYHIRTTRGKVDDYESIREVIARRYTRVLNEKLDKPDLILIDGGKGQVSAVCEILEVLGIPDIPVRGLAKKNEELYSPGTADPARLPETSQVLKLLQAVRDEAHRFATRFNKALRAKNVKLGELEKIPGIGPRRSKQLLETYGSLEETAEQSPEDIAELLHINRKNAEFLLRKLINYKKQ